MVGNFPAVSAVLLLQRMLNLSASYTALLIMLYIQLSKTDVDVLLFTTISRTSRKPFYPDQRQEFWYRSIFLSFNLKIPAGQILYLSGGNFGVIGQNVLMANPSHQTFYPHYVSRSKQLHHPRLKDSFPIDSSHSFADK